MIDWIIGAAMVLTLAALFWMIVTGRPSRGESRGGIASLSAFHDFQAKDKQNAVEMIIEQKAGKRLDWQSTGEGKHNESEQIHSQIAGSPAERAGDRLELREPAH